MGRPPKWAKLFLSRSKEKYKKDSLNFCFNKVKITVQPNAGLKSNIKSHFGSGVLKQFGTTQQVSNNVYKNHSTLLYDYSIQMFLAFDVLELLQTFKPIINNVTNFSKQNIDKIYCFSVFFSLKLSWAFKHSWGANGIPIIQYLLN